MVDVNYGGNKNDEMFFASMIKKSYLEDHNKKKKDEDNTDKKLYPDLPDLTESDKYKNGEDKYKKITANFYDDVMNFLADLEAYKFKNHMNFMHMKNGKDSDGMKKVAALNARIDLVISRINSNLNTDYRQTNNDKYASPVTYNSAKWNWDHINHLYGVDNSAEVYENIKYNIKSELKRSKSLRKKEIKRKGGYDKD